MKRILYWGAALCVAVPLFSSCAEGTSSAKGAPASKTDNAIAMNTATAVPTGAKDKNIDTNMKSVILNVFGMT